MRWMAKLRDALSLLWLLVGPKRSRPERTYRLLGAEQNLGDKTRFLNLGYWAEARHYDDACAALAVLLAERAGLGAAPPETLDVLDCGCGLGDQDALWMDRFAPRRMVAINVTESQLEVARVAQARDGLEYRLASATALPFGDASFDRVLALESSFHFDTRERFLGEALRVLRPGGVLGIADALPVAEEKGFKARFIGYLGRGLWQAPVANLYPVERLVELAEAAGFTDVDVLDISEHVFRPFKAFAKERARAPEIAQRVNPLLRAIWRTEHGGHGGLRYVVLTARKA